MQYAKRIAVLISLIGLSYLNSRIRPDMSNHFTVHTMSYFLINIIFAMTMIAESISIKGIGKTKVIIAIDSFILLLLLMISFFPQINGLFGLGLFEGLQSNAENMRFIYYNQLILGFYLLTFVMILQNPKARRGGSRGTIRYMR